MSITIPKPLIPALKLPTVPGWVAIAALVLQYAITSGGSSSQPDCTMDVQQVHNSTYSNEFMGLDEIKLKVSTKCTSPQISTKVRGEIFKEQSDGTYINVHTFKEILAKPKVSNPNFVLVENLTIPCHLLGDGQYSGFAEGTVTLSNKKVIPLSEYSKKPRTIKCAFGAK